MKVKAVVLAMATSLIFVAPVIADTNTPAPHAPTTTTVKSGPVACKGTYAVGHQAKDLAIPKIKKPFKNKVFTFNTNCGQIVIAADGVKAPLTVLSMAYLANNGFFDQTLCHRLTTKGIYVIQCGDPTASGRGGPKWQVPDENLPVAGPNAYPAGTVAMANSGPNTSGSQFFFLYADNSVLGSNYTIWGHVTKGLEILKAVAAQGSNNSNGDGDGGPNQTFAIERAVAR